jgi:Methyltransferase domain
MSSRLNAAVIDVPDHQIVLKDEWLVPTPHGLDTRWTFRADVIALCYYANICRGNILEIGCNEGNTTAALAFNNPERRIYAVDWLESPSAMIREQRQEKPDIVAKHALEFSNVEVINADSATITYDPSWNIRMVFIDGGHHYAQVKYDSEKAIDHLQGHAGGYVLWHDYGSDRPNWVEVAQYLEREIAPCYDLCVIRDTALALIRVAPAQQERARLRSKIVALERECKLRSEQLGAAEEAIGRLRNEIGSLQEQVAILRAHLDFANHRWNTLLNSRSWALLRPLRVFRRAQKRLFAGLPKRTKPLQPSEAHDAASSQPLAEPKADDTGLSPFRRQVLRRLKEAKARTDA